MSFAAPELYIFLRGPGLVISILVFLTGSLYRIFCLIRATRKIRKISIGAEYSVHRNSTPTKKNFPAEVILFFKNKIRNTISGTNPVMWIVSLVFHLLLFITPVFLSAHNIIADLTIGISLFSFPERLTDIFTILLIALGFFFLIRRIFIPRVRIISTIRDYFIILLVISPFLSGFLAYHHFFNYRIVIFTHMIIGEMAIMIIPFTSLVHMPFFVFSRFFIDSEHSFMPGDRSW